MLKKSIIVASLSLVCVFVFLFVFDEGETRPIVTFHHPSTAKKTHLDTKSSGPMVPENAYAAIVLIPKAYVPVLERFKHSKMGKMIKIMPAKLEWRDGTMTAVLRDNKVKRSSRKNEQKQTLPSKTQTSYKKRADEKRNKVLSAGLLCYLTEIAAAKPRFRTSAGIGTPFK